MHLFYAVAEIKCILNVSYSSLRSDFYRFERTTGGVRSYSLCGFISPHPCFGLANETKKCWRRGDNGGHQSIFFFFTSAAKRTARVDFFIQLNPVLSRTRKCPRPDEVEGGEVGGKERIKRFPISLTQQRVAGYG